MQLVIVQLIPGHGLFAADTFNLCLNDQILKESIDLHELRLVDLAAGAFTPIQSE